MDSRRNLQPQSNVHNKILHSVAAAESIGLQFHFSSFFFSHVFRPSYNLQQSEHIDGMSISAQALRPSPYSIPPPRSHRMAYGSSSAGAVFNNGGGQLQQQPQSPYSISYAMSSPTHPSGAALAFPSLLPSSSPPSMLPPASTTGLLPESPVSV